MGKGPFLEHGETSAYDDGRNQVRVSSLVWTTRCGYALQNTIDTVGAIFLPSSRGVKPIFRVMAFTNGW